jgi:hypothetical protein
MMVRFNLHPHVVYPPAFATLKSTRERIRIRDSDKIFSIVMLILWPEKQAKI